jgi:hypothetical protein
MPRVSRLARSRSLGSPTSETCFVVICGTQLGRRRRFQIVSPERAIHLRQVEDPRPLCAAHGPRVVGTIDSRRTRLAGHTARDAACPTTAAAGGDQSLRRPRDHLTQMDTCFPGKRIAHVGRPSGRARAPWRRRRRTTMWASIGSDARCRASSRSRRPPGSARADFVRALSLLPGRLACVPDELRLPPVVLMRQMSPGLKLAQWSQSPRPELADG